MREASAFQEEQRIEVISKKVIKRNKYLSQARIAEVEEEEEG